jgi:hypothetical protein
MPKSYTDELAEWVKKREATRPRQDKNVVAFLALRDDVKSAIEAGYSLLTIWEHLHEKGRIPYRYETFLKHVRRHIKNRPATPDTPPVIEPAPGRPAAPEQPAPAEARRETGRVHF